MTQKLILPTEIKVCATCSYWDGERKVDPECRLVVVTASCEGECLARGACCSALTDDAEKTDECMWEHLAPDQNPS